MATLGFAQLTGKTQTRTITNGLTQITLNSKIVEEAETTFINTVPNLYNVLPVFGGNLANMPLTELYSVWSVTPRNSATYSKSLLYYNTAMQISLREEWMARTWAATTDRPRREAVLFIKCLSTLFDNVGYCMTPSVTTSSIGNVPNVIAHEDLGERSMLSLADSVENPDVRNALLHNGNLLYMRGSNPDTLPIITWQHDQVNEYYNCVVPLFREERTLYELRQSMLRHFFTDVEAGITLLKRLTPLEYHLDMHEFMKQYGARQVHARVGVPIAYSVPVEIYYCNARIMLRTAEKVQTGITIRIEQNDTQEAAREVRICLRVAALIASEAQRIVLNLSPLAPAQVYPALMLPMINPNLNITVMLFSRNPITPIDLFSMLIMFTLCSCHTVHIDTRINFNNAIAYFLINDCLSNPTMSHPLIELSHDYNRWFMTNEDKLLALYQAKGILTNQAIAFIEYLLFNDRSKLDLRNTDTRRISTTCEAIWANGNLLNNPITHSLSEPLQNVMKISNKPIVIPYNYNDLRDFKYTRFNKLCLLLNECMVTRTLNKVIVALKSTTDAIVALILRSMQSMQMYFNNVIENLDRMASLPVTDPIPNLKLLNMPTALQISLSDVLSCIIFPSQEPLLQGPHPVVLNFDPEVTIGLPLLVGSYNRIESLLGDARNLFKRGAKMQIARDMFSIVPMISSEVLDMWLNDAASRDSMVEILKETQTPLNAIFDCTNTLFGIMNNPIISQHMGFTDHLYIVVEPYDYIHTHISGYNIFSSTAIRRDRFDASSMTQMTIRDIAESTLSTEITGTQNIIFYNDAFSNRLNQLNVRHNHFAALAASNQRRIMAIKIMCDVIIDFHIIESTELRKPVVTKLDIAEIKKCYREMKPIVVRAEVHPFSTLHSVHPPQALMAFDDYAHYLVVDFDQLPFDLTSHHEYLGRSTGEIITRKKPLEFIETLDVKYIRTSDPLM